MPPSPAPPTREPHWLLRRTDQAAAASLVAAGLLAVVGWWVYRGGVGGRLVEIDHSPPQQAVYAVDVNSAAWPELAQVPGLGRSLAERIVNNREQDGPFADLDELRRVRGIGPRTLETLRPYLRPIPKRTAVAGP